MGKEQVVPQEETAMTRYRIISPILTAMEESADKGKIGLLKSEACALAGISRKTLWRWLTRYAQNGFDGLKYQGADGEKKRLIPGELVKEAILLRLEVPSRSVPQLIEILELEGKAPVGFLKRSTLQDRLREEGYTSAQMKLYQKPGIASRRFTRAERGDLWQADISSGHTSRSARSGSKSTLWRLSTTRPDISPTESFMIPSTRVSWRTAYERQL